MKILIATPAYDEKITTSYFTAMIGVKELFERNLPRIESDFFVFSHALIAYSRNVFVSRMLEHPEYTHLLMVDADMGFHPNLIFRMLQMDKPICASTYPKRYLDLDRLMNIVRAMPEDNPAQRQKALNAAYEYVAEGDLALEGEGNLRTLNLDRGFVRCQAAGTGIMLIKREVIERMRAHFPELVAPTVPGGATTLTKEFFQPFNEFASKDGHILSEDLSFCHRWTTVMGGELWTNVDDEIIHHGTMKFKARFLDKVMSIAMSSTLTDEVQAAG